MPRHQVQEDRDADSALAADPEDEFDRWVDPSRFGEDDGARRRGRARPRRADRRGSTERTEAVASGDSIPRSERTSWLKNRRADGQESFRCRHCRQMVGPTVSGGRHRNHCPLCLYSRHVDDRRPGDRASTCGSVMAPVGLLTRRNGEQVILHRCLGCGREKPNRIAADDNDLALEALPPIGGDGQAMADALALMDTEPA